MFSVDQKRYITQYVKLLFVTKKIIPSLIVVIISIVVSIHILNRAIPNDHYSPTQIQTTIIQKAIEKFEDNANIPRGELLIKSGPLYIADNEIQSQNNLIKLAGFVIPKNSTIYSINTLKDVDFFSNTGYNTDELRLQIGAILNGSLPTNTQNKHNNNTLPTASIYTSFDLGCIQQTIHSPLCTQNIENFLAIFYTFELEPIAHELATIIQNLQRKSHKEMFCKKLLIYSQYNQSFNSHIQTAIQSCDIQTQQYYQRMQYLHTINTEIQNNTFTQTVYDDADLNAYKIMSLAQNIIHDIQQDTVNARRIEAYSNQLQTLLREPTLEPIYRDIQYRIINYHIIPYLQENSNKNPTYNNINNLLLSLNRENTLLQHSGLQNMIINKALIIQQQEIQSIANNNIQSMIQWLQSLPYITIDETKVSNQDILIQWYLNIIDSIAWESRTAFSATGQINLNRLIIEEIDLPEYQLFTTIINAFIQTRNTTLPGLYSYINENIALYRTQQNQEICNQLDNINTFTTNICNASLIQWEQKIQNTVTTYKITIENNTIWQIQTSDTQLTDYLNQKYQSTVSDAIRIPWLIQEIITTQIPTTTNNQEEISIDTETINVINTFSLFFKTSPTDVKYIQDLYYIDFTIDDINFVLTYNPQRNITGPLFFKDIIINEKPLRVSKRSIALEPDSNQTINKFVANPLAYIQEVDPFTYQTYLQLK